MFGYRDVCEELVILGVIGFWILGVVTLMLMMMRDWFRILVGLKYIGRVFVFNLSLLSRS